MMANITSLPVELLIQILSYLEVSDLYNIGDTCLWLHTIINNDELWKNLFIKKFLTQHFSSCSKSQKYSVELFKRNEILHKWKKSTGIHKNISIPASSISQMSFNYPRVLTYNDQGSINILSVEKSKTEMTIPLITQSTCYSFNSNSSVFGRWDGKIFGKLLASKSYLSSITEFNKQHEDAVISIYNDDSNCYSGDNTGKLFVWELKNGTFLKEYKISTNPLVKIKGLNNLIITTDFDFIYIIENNDDISTIPFTLHEISYFNVDFGGKLVIIGSDTELIIFSFDKSTFGRSNKIIVEEGIHCVSMETKNELKNQRLAGYDGCNFGIVSTTGRVMIHNIRNLKLQDNKVIPKVSIVPIFDDLKLNGLPPINSIDINSTVLLLGSYNGYCATYNALTGEFIKIVSTRVPKRYLPLTAPLPVKSVKLGNRDDTNGVLLVGNVVQYFQFGELSQQNSITKKKKKNLTGTTNDRKDRMRKHIKHDLDDLDHQDYQSYKQEQLLDKYNGVELDHEEQIQLAMVLNASIQGQPNSKKTGKEVDDDDFIDDELATALELSKLEHQYSGEGTSSSNATKEEDFSDQGFDEQLKEAMRRSLYQ